MNYKTTRSIQNNRTTALTIFLMGLLITSSLSASSIKQKPSITEILKQIDAQQTIEKDVTAKVAILQQDIEQGIKQMESIYFAKNSTDKFLIVMTAPESEKGNGYLKSDEHFWMYRRNTRTFQHISRDESIAGSDANTSDFETPKYELQYKGKKDANDNDIIQIINLGNIPAYKIDVVSDLPNVAYPNLTIWVRQDNLLPLKIQNKSYSNSLISTQYFLKYSKINDKFIAIKQMVMDNFEKGNKTVWEITDITFRPIDDHIFTKAYLENLSN